MLKRYQRKDDILRLTELFGGKKNSADQYEEKNQTVLGRTRIIRKIMHFDVVRLD